VYDQKVLLSADELFEIEISSWVDRFMILPIDIRGYKMDYSEVDFWWLLAKKHKFFKTKSIPFDVKIFLRNNDIKKYPQLRTAERMGVKPVTCGDSFQDVYAHSCI